MNFLLSTFYSALFMNNVGLMKSILLFIIVFIFSNPLFSQGEIEININNLSNDKGQVVVLLFKKGQEFGMGKTPYKKYFFESISNNKISFSIPNIALGEYALLLFHDENKDGIFDTNWIGMPKEGVGKSGVQDKRPDYENSKFVLDEVKIRFDVNIKYLL